MGIFKWNKERSKSVDSGQTSIEDIRVQLGSSSSQRRSIDVGTLGTLPEYSQYDDTPPDDSLDNESIALSEADTLLYDKRQGLELQDTFEDNFTHYYPFLLRRMRLESMRAAELAANIRKRSSSENKEEPVEEPEDDVHSDGDASTVLNESIDSQSPTIFTKPIPNFNLRRDLVIISEFLKNATYIFPSKESFETFRDLRKSTNKKNSSQYAFVYDSQNKVKKIKQDTVKDYPGSVVDSRQHLIPLDSKSKGLGLPLFKVQVPYLASFKKNAAFMIFKRYREKPTRPSLDPGKDEEFESYNFCTVYTKHFQKAKRVTFHFNVEGGESFRVLMFMNNFKPYSDFTYHSTRFRVLGTPIITTLGLTYNPSLKLLLIDSDKPSLCDNIINKKATFDFLKILKKDADIEHPEDVVFVEGDYSTYVNPYPSSTNDLFDEDPYFPLTGTRRKVEYVSEDFPPFGSFQDSILYDQNSNILPKKFSELGKLQMYQDFMNNRSNSKSTTLFDVDTLVLACIMATLREIAIKSAGKAINSNNRLASKNTFIGGMNSAALFM